MTGKGLEQTDLPVSFIHGGKTGLIGGMDEVISGRRVGDEVDMLLRAEDTLGAHDPSLTFADKLADIPQGFRFVDAEVPMQNASGDQ